MRLLRLRCRSTFPFTFCSLLHTVVCLRFGPFLRSYVYPPHRSPRIHPAFTHTSPPCVLHLRFPHLPLPTPRTLHRTVLTHVATPFPVLRSPFVHLYTLVVPVTIPRRTPGTAHLPHTCYHTFTTTCLALRITPTHVFAHYTAVVFWTTGLHTPVGWLRLVSCGILVVLPLGFAWITALPSFGSRTAFIFWVTSAGCSLQVPPTHNVIHVCHLQDTDALLHLDTWIHTTLRCSVVNTI